MITPELLSYIRAELAKGRNKQAIHDDLIAGGGWLTEDVDEAFRELGGVVQSQPVPAPVPEPVVIAPQTPVDLPVQPTIPEIPDPLAQPMSMPEPQSLEIPGPVAPAEPVVIAPAAPIPEPTPVVVQPTIVVQPQIVQPVIQPQPAPAPVQVVQKRKPYLFSGVVLCIASGIALIISLVITSSSVLNAFLLAVFPRTFLGLIIPVFLIVEIVFALIGGWILDLVTRWLDIPEPSWHKGVYCMGWFTFIGALFSIIEMHAKLSLSFVLILILLAIGLGVLIIVETYHIRPGRAILVGIIMSVLMAVVTGILGGIFSVIFTSMQKSNTPPTPIMAPSSTINTINTYPQ
ncbi:MAG TPA: hypothetical protein VL576_01805 [Candidatus Paceibacterota bacterium]|jgi:hypothetical protein|nr:hypothetical protein [Candidatus Paceibacterota bacterium]